MTCQKYVKRVAFSATAILLLSVSPAAAAPRASSDKLTVKSQCISYARKHEHKKNWLCVGNQLLTFTKKGGEYIPVRRATVDDSGALTVSPSPRDFLQKSSTADGSAGGQSAVNNRVLTSDGGGVVNSYTDNASVLIGGIFGTKIVAGGFSAKTVLYNHSPALSLKYSSESPISLTFRIRIRQDRSLALDKDVFDYPEVYGSSTYTTLWTGGEDQYGDAFNKLPYDGGKYFIEFYDGSLGANGGRVLLGAFMQTDRMTCYKTVPCKF